MNGGKPIGDVDLEMLQSQSFSYFLNETNPDNGLVIDKTATDWPASIAATGFALAAYPVGVERGFISRDAAVARTLTTLRFFWNSPQGPEPDVTGYKGLSRPLEQATTPSLEALGQPTNSYSRDVSSSWISFRKLNWFTKSPAPAFHPNLAKIR
jgi:hypothetical protein